ncbi:hypothetical protein LUZ60_013062 [Juncus effusus]|nr:hypothetical protein LUZ60_013062 [Juncus effusus]
MHTSSNSHSNPKYKQTSYLNNKYTNQTINSKPSLSFHPSPFFSTMSPLTCSNFSLFLFLLTFTIFLMILPSSAMAVGLAKRHKSSKKPVPIPIPIPGFTASKPSCDIYTGTWVRDDSYPLYQSLNCPIIDSEFNCQLYGRPDTDYLKYRWKPLSCDLPRFDGVDFLTRMRGKSVMFVGDSLGRNQWESLICMIHASVPQSATQMSGGDPLYIYKFLEYGVTISFYRAPYLVDIESVQGKRVLRLDDISNNAIPWRGADILSFNSGHWWTHKGSLQGWDYMGDGGVYYNDMDRQIAFQKGLTTWANWVDQNIDPSRTRVFFQSISPTHYNQNEWANPMSKNCYGETVPISGSNYTGPYPAQMQVIRSVLNSMRTPVKLLDITTLSQLRKDAHPSIYSGDLTPVQKTDPDHSADCSHWCLPGLPDTWNQLFYASLFFS